MSRQSWLSKVYWKHFAKPVQERLLFRFLIENTITSILEVGVGDGARMRRISHLLQRTSGIESIRYIGVDEFESAQDRPFLTLKEAHRIASQLGFKASLIPGTAATAVTRVAHKFGPSDLIIVDGGLDLADPTSGPIGGWLNRLAHDRSTVLACSKPGQSLVVVERKYLDLPLVKAA